MSLLDSNDQQKSEHEARFDIYLPRRGADVFLWKETRSRFPAYFDVNGSMIDTELTIWGGKGHYLSRTTRRSFAVQSNGAMLLRRCSGNRQVSDRIILHSLWEDKRKLGYMTSIRLLRKLGLWHAASCLVELRVATESDKHPGSFDKPVSAGMYLAVENPADALRSALALGRSAIVGVHKRINVVSFDTFEESPELTEAFEKVLKARTPEELGALIDLPVYFKWIAFNALTKNRDFWDELILAFKPNSSQLSLHAWDYENVFQSCSHGFPTKTYPTNDMVHCPSSPVVRFLYYYPGLKTEYMKQLRIVLDHVTEAAFINAVNQTMQDIQVVAEYALDLKPQDRCDFETHKITQWMLRQFRPQRRKLAAAVERELGT